MNVKNLTMMVLAVFSAGVITCEARAATPTVAPQAGNIGDRAVGPRIEFDSTNLDFGKAMAGRAIDHTFVFTNTGDNTLEILDVRPTCGCTIAGTWDRRVEPGHAGKIPIRYTPADYGDPEILKTVIVLCNDSSHSNVVLQIKGTIWKPIEVKPTMVMFSTTSSECQTNQTRVVHIVNNVETPLALSEPLCDDQVFKLLLKTLKPGKEFELSVTLDPLKQSGNLSVPISIKTSSTNMPVINIVAFAVVQPELMSTPAQIMLVPGQLQSNMQSRVTIQNNRAEPLVMSEPVVNISGVAVRLTETQPGRQFLVTADFPSGFYIPRGQNVQIRIKTNDPKNPVFTVPVYQARRLSASLDTQASDQSAFGGNVSGKHN
jgi:hypothetical protein